VNSKEERSAKVKTVRRKIEENNRQKEKSVTQVTPVTRYARVSTQRDTENCFTITDHLHEPFRFRSSVSGSSNKSTASSKLPVKTQLK
jgi:hypothetical protein